MLGCSLQLVSLVAKTFFVFVRLDWSVSPARSNLPLFSIATITYVSNSPPNATLERTAPMRIPFEAFRSRWRRRRKKCSKKYSKKMKYLNVMKYLNLIPSSLEATTYAAAPTWAGWVLGTVVKVSETVCTLT